MALRSVFLSLAVTLFAPSISCGQTERIHAYHSQVEVLEDGSLKVTDTITVTSTGNKIKRGIYRDFPTVYTSKYLVKIELPFEVISVKRDSKPEPFHTKSQSNGMRIYVGSEDTLLTRGRHTYEIAYTTNYQLGYFETHDELYWNVTGNGWRFPIDQASATVILPESIPREKLTHEGYTGPEGSKAQNLTSRVDQETGALEFSATTKLDQYEGFTVVAGFPKGYVREPTAAEQRALYLSATVTIWLVLGGLLVVLSYYFWAWLIVGHDPPGGTVYPQFKPPLDLPPACVRYVRRMGYDKKCFTAALINIAVKGFMAIEEENGEYTLNRNKQATRSNLSFGERILAKRLLSTGSFKIKQTNHRQLSGAIQQLGERLAAEYEGELFRKNRWWLVPGWLLSVTAIVVVALSADWQALPIVGFMSVWLSGWTLACVALGTMVVRAWRSVLALRRNTLGRIGSFAGAIFITAFSMPFFCGEVFGIVMLVAGTTIWIVPLLLGLVAINWTFWYLIKQPTVEGQRVLDGIEGFRMYLSTAEGESLQRMHPPEQTPELFEKYLPYALALDVENEWSEKFSDVLAQAASAAGETADYHPRWCHGDAWDVTASAAFAGGLASSMGGAISSSSTAPGSSSGGGGGGSSGGGGGGGGGGGW